MVEFITSWAEQIIVALIIVIIFELIIPEGKNKKYIKLVMGLFILYSIISPISGNKIKNININNILEESNVEMTSNNDISNLVVDSNIEKMYEENVISSIEDTLKEKGYSAKNIKLKINYEEGDNYGIIESVEMQILTGKTSENKNIKIEEVNINNSNNEQSNITDEELEEIKKLIGDTYSVKYENIIIGR